MKKIYILQKLAKVFQHTLFLMLIFSFFAGKINAQTYVNGNLSTGAMSSNNLTAPAGFTWSEVQLGNGTIGAGAQINANNSLADDFTVPAGPSWGITKFTFYAYSTNAAGVFDDLRFQIFNTDPSVGNPTPIFGNLTTNRLTSASSAGMYRIQNAPPATQAPYTQREIKKLEANVSLTLAPGTYWVEFQTGVTPVTASNFCPSSTVVGTTTQPGNNAYQRIATAWGPFVDGTSNARQDVPFRIDYSTGACSGTPAPGNTLASLATVCPGININLSLQNGTTGSGVTYQWQSATSMAGPYTNISGAMNATYSTTISVSTYFQCLVTCSGNTGTSTPVQVMSTPSSGCYCTAGSPDIQFEKISNVSYNTINNASTSTAGYENFTAISTTVIRGSTLPITVSISTPFASDQVIVWIDFNQNGNFSDPGEMVYMSATGVGPHTGNITIPTTASLGPTRMRIRMHDTQGAPPNATPCGNSEYGQVEDYTVDIAPCVALTITTQPANATVECGANATFSLAATGSGPAYQWQQRINATSVWTNVTNGGMFAGATTNTLTITGVLTGMSGYQYRAVYSGFCRSTDFTNPATLTVTPLVAIVNPPAASICNGAIQQLTISNVTSPSPATTTVASGPISVTVPDNVNTGANHTINVTSVPAGALVTGISVTINMPHTYCGDMLFNLKAPNNTILALNKYLNGTGNQAGVYPNIGFVNTVISSAGTVALSTAASQPITGTYRADLLNTLPAGFVVQNPVGFVSTATAWSQLYNIPNGNWTLAMADGGPGDIGTLTSWSITINYLVGLPATGVWGPTTPTNTIYSDAAATIPYVAGTAANSVYVKPTTTTTYNVVVTTPTCVSAATNIPVTVNNPLGTVTAPTSMVICQNKNASFTVSASTGNVIAYTWEVSTDAGVTWNTVNNGGVYSGATTATLMLTGVPVSFDGYRYRAMLSVSACASTATSGAASLNVNPNPVVTIGAPTVTQLYPGLTSSLTASPAGATTYQWYRNGVAVAGNSNPLIVDVDGLGTYSVTVTDANGCTGSSTVSRTITAAPNDILFIYPSPTTGQFQVRYQSEFGNVLPRTLTIYDSKGSRVYSKTYSINVQYSRMDVDLTNLGKGVYRVELGDRNGNRIKTGSVLVL